MAVLIRIEERRCHSHHPLAAKGETMRLKGSSFWCCLRNNTNNDNVITEHAGDIYSLCNETEKAVEYWQEALDKGNDHKELLEKKIKQKQYIAK